jgi:hypothetical protein
MLKEKEIYVFNQMLTKLDQHQIKVTMYYLFDYLDEQHKNAIWSNFRFNKDSFMNKSKEDDKLLS